MKPHIQVKQGDCLKTLQAMESDSIDLIYLDPPFFTQKIQKLKNRERTKEFQFSDLWSSHQAYADFLHRRMLEMHRVLANTGSLFFHCDKSASHIVRILLDEIFGETNFRSEIVWYYKRWSNAKKGLLPAHQVIFFYSKSKKFKFNTIYQDYSESTNIEQLLQQRQRDAHGKAIYAKDEKGQTVCSQPKKGVPLNDVWEIPYLNPKAKERTGYPTQKPLLLLERIIRLTTHPNDWVLDPFCGSGTTLVASQLLVRNAMGIDISEDAIKLTKERLKNPVKTNSYLLQKGRRAYLTANKPALGILEGVDIVPVQRNHGIDAILRKHYNQRPVLIRVQRENETLLEAAKKLYQCGKTKHA